MKDQIENELNIIRAGLDCAPSSSTNNAARHALLRLYDLLLADQPAATETAPVCDYWPNGPAPCGKLATHRGRGWSGTRLFCSYHAVEGDTPLAKAAPQGAPLTPTRSMAVGEMAEMLTTGRAPQGAPESQQSDD